MTEHRAGQRTWPLAALLFALGFAAIRLYWALGGRWGYTACDRTASPNSRQLATGCGADELTALPLWQGWGAVALGVVLAGIAALCLLRRGRLATGAAWGAGTALIVLAFPLHLLFQLPAGLAGRPTDWADMAGRLLLLAGGLLFWAAGSSTRRCGHPHLRDPRPMPRWVRGWAYAGVAIPVLGWTVPHALWLAGVPFGISPDFLAGADMGWALGGAITFLPGAASLLTLGLAQRWGQVVPEWLPGLAGRRVPRLLALVPAVIVAMGLASYGLLSMGVIARELASGGITAAELAAGWAVTATAVVFFGWGVALGITAFGYARTTRPRCPACPAPS